jgi:hypothetical protein
VPISQHSRNTLYRALVEVIDDRHAVSEFLSFFPPPGASGPRLAQTEASIILTELSAIRHAVETSEQRITELIRTGGPPPATVP